MKFDTEKVDDAILALMFLGLHDGYRTWKGFDWGALDRLHAKGFIGDPVGKAKSVVMTTEGLERSEALFSRLFGEDDTAPGRPLPPDWQPLHPR